MSVITEILHRLSGVEVVKVDDTKSTPLYLDANNHRTVNAARAATYTDGTAVKSFVSDTGQRYQKAPANIEIIGVLSASVPHFYKAMQFLENNQQRFSFIDLISNTYRLEEANVALKSMEQLQEIKPAILPS